MNKVIKSTLSNAKKGKWFTLASIVVMSASFFMLSIFATVGIVSNDVIKYLESRAQITIFFKDSATVQEITKFKTDLEEDLKIVEVVYTSKESALDSYITEHKGDPLLLESLTKDIFPASLDIRAKDISYLPIIEEKFKNNEKIEEVVYYKDALSTFKKFSDVMRYGGAALVGLLLLTSVVIVLLTVGSSIYVKNDEIAVMRLVGASNWYIRAPFLLQGVFYGLVASLISEVFLVLLASFLGNDMRDLFVGINIVRVNWLFLIIAFFVQLTFGTLLGLLGSWGALRRYLKI